MKVYPEQPALEYLVTELDRRLGIKGTPTFELVKFEHGEKTSAAVLTSAVPGDTLQELLNKSPDDLQKKLSLSTFVHVLLRVLLTNPEDDKGDDYFLTKDGKLMRIDNERTFFPPDYTRPGWFSLSKNLLVKSIIYCLGHMETSWGKNSAITEIVEDFLSLDPVSVITDLLQQTDRLHNGWNLLFTEAELIQHFHCKEPWNSLPVMCIPKGLARELISRLTNMHIALQLDGTKMTGLQLLKVTQPKLAQHYEDAFSSTTISDPTPSVKSDSKDAPQETKTEDHPVNKRFRRVVGWHYKKNARGHLQTQTPPSLAIQSSLRLERPIDAKLLPDIRTKKIYSVQQELVEFRKWTETSLARLFQDLLEQKSVAAIEWQSLSLHHQQLIFKTLQKKALTEKPKGLSSPQKKFILDAMANIAWPQLDLQGFEDEVTQDVLADLLKKSGKYLLVLNISGCTKLKDASLRKILRYNPNLQRLDAQHVRWSTFDLTPFKHLRYLDLSYSQIRALSGTLRLHNLQLAHCKQLEQLSVKNTRNIFVAPRLLTINLNSCENLKSLCLPETFFHGQVHLDIDSCPSLKEIDFQTEPHWLKVTVLVMNLIQKNSTLSNTSGTTDLSDDEEAKLLKTLQVDVEYTI